MATYAARIAAHADAVLNATASLTQKDRLGRAVAARVGRLAEYDAGTQAVKAQIAVDEIGHMLIGLVREFEGGDADRAARAVVDADFPVAL